jgi:TctA family transporter
VAVSVGIFGITEMLRNLESTGTREVFIKKVVGLMPTKADLKAIVAPVIRGTVIGSFLGVLPGGGSILASFAAYTVEKKVAKDPSRFGKGAIEGVASPESANNAGAQTSFIPMLTLGIPGNPVMAMMMGAMIIQGIVPGPAVATDQPRLFWGIIASMWIGNAMLVILNLPLIGLWVRLLTVPYYLLIPVITVFSTIGVYSVTNSVYDVYTMIGLGIFGYVLAKLDFEPAPLVLGFVLGPMFEEHLRRSMILSRGDPMIFLQRPISAALLIVALIAIVIALLPMIAKKRDQVFVEEG